MHIRSISLISESASLTSSLNEKSFFISFSRAEEEIKTVTDSGEIVLSRVVIPEYIVVHDGAPSDSTANNYYYEFELEVE